MKLGEAMDLKNYCAMKRFITANKHRQLKLKDFLLNPSSLLFRSLQNLEDVMLSREVCVLIHLLILHAAVIRL